MLAAMRRLSIWARVWLVVAALVAAAITFVGYAISDFHLAYTGLDRSQLGGMVFIFAVLGVFAGAVLWCAAIAARWLWRVLQRKN